MFIFIQMPSCIKQLFEIFIDLVVRITFVILNQDLCIETYGIQPNEKKNENNNYNFPVNWV